MSPLRNLPIRSSSPPASSADGKEDATTAEQQSTHSPRYSPTQVSAALPGLTSCSLQQEDEFGLWRLQTFLSSQQPLPSEPTDISFEQMLPQSLSALMGEATSNFSLRGSVVAPDMCPAAPPHPYVDPRVLSVLDSAPAQQASSLTQPPVLPADSQLSAALGSAHGKRPLSVEPDTAQQLAKRPACGEGVEPDAASGNLNPAWPQTWDAGEPIVCTPQVLHNLCNTSMKERAQQLKHHGCVGQPGVRAVTAACVEKGGTLVLDSPPGTYKFENVVLEKGTQVGRSKSATLPTEQRIHAVYLQLQRGKDGTDELKDFHIHVPATVPAQSGKYSNDAKTILANIGSQRGEGKHRATVYRKENPPPEYTFQTKDKMNHVFNHHKILLQKLGYPYAHELDQMLRDCKEVLGKLGELDESGNLPHEGEKKLTLERHGKKVDVQWVFKNGKTADLVIAENKKELQKKIIHQELIKNGIVDNKRAKAVSKATWNKTILGNIAKRHTSELKDLGWTDREQWKKAVRDISLQCEAAGEDSKEGESPNGTEIEGVGEFKLKGVGPAEKDIQVLRWVDQGELREIKFFHENEREKTMTEMKNFIRESLKRRNT